ncbi:MAG: hypothetical protein JKY54_16455 [Flavobacteriales bacterium]|nr:hypothetical protein [Flavobacteriales bacterium]
MTKQTYTVNNKGNYIGASPMQVARKAFNRLFRSTDATKSEIELRRKSDPNGKVYKYIAVKKQLLKPEFYTIAGKTLERSFKIDVKKLS